MAKIPDAIELPSPEKVIANLVDNIESSRRFVSQTDILEDVDPIEKEVVIGAAVTLVDEGNKKTYKTETDSYGDFEFENLPVGNFVVTINDSNIIKEIIVSTEKDVSLGDIPLTV